MASSSVSLDKIEGLYDPLGLDDLRTKEDFKIFFFSALERYKELRPSYIVRNVSFLCDSMYITLSHATNAKKNPSGFGLALGSFAGLLTKAEDSTVCESIFKNEMAFKFFNKCLELIKKVEGFDMVFLKDIIDEMDTSRLGPDELHEFTTLVGSI